MKEMKLMKALLYTNESKCYSNEHSVENCEYHNLNPDELKSNNLSESDKTTGAMLKMLKLHEDRSKRNKVFVFEVPDVKMKHFMETRQFSNILQSRAHYSYVPMAKKCK